jgi:hypothetical protein
LANNEVLVRDTLNSRLDRSNARGGAHFKVSKLKIEVKVAETDTVTETYSRPGFNHNDPCDILRLNRWRQSVFDREIGPLPCPPKGKEGDWWHDLEKWEVERRYVLRDPKSAGFPGWSEMADEHNFGFQNRRLPGSPLAPVVRKHNKITQHINRQGLNKHKDKGGDRHKHAQRDINADHDKIGRVLQDAFESGFSATKEDVDILDAEDAAATLVQISNAQAAQPDGQEIGDEEDGEEEGAGKEDDQDQE